MALVGAGAAAVLAARGDDAEVIALWRAHAARLGLPALLERADGALEALRAPLPAPPRRGAGRPRPRALARRAVGRPGAGPVHRGREIIARD